MNPSPFHVDPKSPLICPCCGQTIIQCAGVTPGHSGTVGKGQLFVCASCGQCSIVGDSNLENLSKDKFDTLPSHVQKALSAVVQTLRDTEVKTTDLN